MGIAGVAAGAAIAGSAVSVASGIDSMTSGGGSTSQNGGGGSVPTGYQPTAQPQFDQYYQQLVGSMLPYATDVPNQTMLRNQQAYQALSNNPYGGTAQNAANSAGAYATGTLAPMERAGAASLQGLGNTAAGYAPQILQTGFDPQNALYDRTQQQIKDQLSATNAQSGLSGTPYGAGVMGQGLSNFNIDWQNQQLNRQIQATQGYGNLTSTAGKGYAGAAELGGLATSTETMGGNLPYSTFAGQQNDVINASNSYAGAANNAFGLDQNTLNALSAYLKLGQSATSVGQAGQGQAFNQGQTLGGNLGAGLSGLGSGISGLSGIFGGGNSGGGAPTYDPNNPFSSGWSSAPPSDPMAMGGFGFPVGGQG